MISEDLTRRTFLQATWGGNRNDIGWKLIGMEGPTHSGTRKQRMRIRLHSPSTSPLILSSWAPVLSVVNKYHRTHAVPNLFLGDGSSFVTSGRGQPTMALAFRAAEHIAAATRNNEI